MTLQTDFVKQKYRKDEDQKQLLGAIIGILLFAVIIYMVANMLYRIFTFLLFL